MKSKEEVKKTSKNKIGYKKAQQNIAQILGFERYLKLDHTPAAMRKSTIENYFAQKPEMLLNNIKYKLRHPTYYMIQSLANHLEIQNKTCTVKNKYQLEYCGWAQLLERKNKHPQIRLIHLGE